MVRINPHEVEINNRIYRVKLEDELIYSLNQWGLKGKRNHIMSEINPMPGLVFKIMKQAGDTVIEGETLWDLRYHEKMENSKVSE